MDKPQPEIPMKGLEIWACEWEDAHFDSNEFERANITHRPVNYVTVGILIQDDDIGITFATDICEVWTFRQTNFVPRKMVVRAWKVGSLSPKSIRKSRQIRAKKTITIKIGRAHV